MIGAVLAAVPIICYYIKQGKRKQDMCDCCKSSVFIALLFFYAKGLRVVVYLVVVAHPDDEVLGAGATICKLVEEGHIVDVCILCSKAEARANRPDDNEMQEDLFASMNMLGVHDVYLGNFVDSQLNMSAHLKIVQFIEEALKRSSATRVITHHPSDLNNDHQITSLCCQEAARLSMRMTANVPHIELIAFMEVPSSTDWMLNHSIEAFLPNTFIEVGKKLILKKIEALGKYKNVIRPFPHPRSANVLEALAAYRGGQSGCNDAEAFQVVFRREL